MSVVTTEAKYHQLIRRCIAKKQFSKTINRCRSILTNLNKLSKASTEEGALGEEEKYKHYLRAYHRITTFVQRSVVLKLVDILIKRFYRLYPSDPLVATPLSPRQFLSAYVMAGYPELVLSVKSEQNNDSEDSEDNSTTSQQSSTSVGSVNHDMYTCSKDLVASINGLLDVPSNENFRNLAKEMNVYSNIFNLFIAIDKAKKVTDLVRQWCDTERVKKETTESKSYDQEKKVQITASLTANQNQTPHMIKKLDPSFDPAYLNICIRTIDNMNKAYWDLLGEDIASGQYTRLLTMLREIQSDLLALCPNNQAFQSEVKSFFDLEVIQQLLNNQAMSSSGFLQYGQYIVSKILLLQAPIHGQATQQEWTQLLQQLNPEAGFAVSIPPILKFIVKEINQVKEDILNFQILADLGLAHQLYGGAVMK